MAKGNIGTSLRRAPRCVPTGQTVRNAGNRRANFKKGDEVINRVTGVTGTVAECFVLNLAVLTTGITEPKRLVSTPYDEWQVKGHVFAGHGCVTPARSELAQGYGMSGRELAEASAA
jgi:hypothetical protein